MAFRVAQHHKAELVLIDNFSTCAEVADENDAAAMTPTLAFLLRLKQARIACVLVHHSGKSGATFRGSSKLATTFEVILGLLPAENGTHEGAAFRLEWTKYRREPNAAVQGFDVRLVKDPEGGRQWVQEETADDDIRHLVAAVRTCDHGKQRDVAAALGWQPSKVTRTKVRAIREKRITEEEWNLCLREASAGKDDAADF